MQMFAFRNTEAGIRQMRAMRAQQIDVRALNQQMEEMRQQIVEMQARLDDVRQPVIPELPQHHVYRSTFQRLEARTCRLFRMKRSELYASRRQKEFTLARQFLMYWACRRTTLSLPQIGRLMRRDHTTVLHGKQAYVAKRAKMGRTLRSVR